MLVVLRGKLLPYFFNIIPAFLHTYIGASLPIAILLDFKKWSNNNSCIALSGQGMRLSCPFCTAKHILVITTLQCFPIMF